VSRVFVPGFGALPSFYRDALASDWTVHEPPSFRDGPSLEARGAALRAMLDRSTAPLTLAGHSMGAALAVAAALERPERVERLFLVAPAGLPLGKPIALSLRDFCGQVASRMYAWRELAIAARSVLAAPRAALGLAHAVRALDLTEQLGELRRLGVRCDVVGCVSDTLTPVAHCREIARLAGARYREVDAAGGHMWMLAEPAALAGALLD
jgi:pimeloyl-ACP methyl ester carboxylesterase